MSYTKITAEEKAYWRRIIDEDCLVGDNAKIWRLLDALEQAEAENARLAKMVDWLAEKCAMHCHDKSTDDSQCNISDCGPVHCLHASADEWKEAASQSVADAESEVEG